MIRNIIFDLNKVIVTYENHPESAELDRRHKEVTGLKQRDFWHHAMKHFDEYNEGRVNFCDYMKIVFDELNLPYSEIPRMQELHSKCFRFIEGMPGVLDYLSRNYYMVLLAGDGFQAEKMKIDRFGLRKYFDKIYMTCHEKTNKENPLIYRKVLEENNMSADKTLFIDDLAKHIYAAKRVGIHTIQFTNTSGLVQDLEQYGIYLKNAT